MPGSNVPSTAATKVPVVKTTKRSGDMQQGGGKEAKNNSKSKNKGKGKGKGKGKAKAGNDVGDGSPVRAPSSRQPADPWDDLRNAWAIEISQSKEGGPSQGTHPNQNRNQNQNRSQKQKQPPKNQNQNQNQNHHPNGRQSGSASSAQNKRGRGGGGGGGDGSGGAHVHAGQKRKATESVTGDRGGRAPKRQKSEKRPQSPPSRSTQDPQGAVARSHPDFWHPDGSVIIQVEKTKFRLHQSMLQKFSAYFAAMFRGKGSHRRGGRAFLEVEIDERSPNGHHLPVYRVAETTADDFATLLTVIEESTCVTVLSFLPHVHRVKLRSLTVPFACV